MLLGGSFISAELASAVRSTFKEAEVSLVSRSPMLFQKIFGNRVGQHIQDFIESNNVTVLNNREVLNISSNSNN